MVEGRKVQKSQKLKELSRPTQTDELSNALVGPCDPIAPVAVQPARLSGSRGGKGSPLTRPAVDFGDGQRREEDSGP